MTRRTSKIVYGVVAVLSVGMAFYAWHYLVPQTLAPPGVRENPMIYPWLMIHAGLAGIAMVLGPFQFLTRLRVKQPRLHRWMGGTYVFACLTGGVAGLLLASGSTAGPIAQYGFGFLGLAWLLTTGMAWRMALARRFDDHRRWMIRSFALTFAAVTLRLYLPFPPLMGFSFVEGYRAISWLCWVPNLIAAELYLARGRMPKTVIAGA